MYDSCNLCLLLLDLLDKNAPIDVSLRSGLSVSCDFMNNLKTDNYYQILNSAYFKLLIYEFYYDSNSDLNISVKSFTLIKYFSKKFQILLGQNRKLLVKIARTLRNFAKNV